VVTTSKPADVQLRIVHRDGTLVGDGALSGHTVSRLEMPGLVLDPTPEQPCGSLTGVQLPYTVTASAADEEVTKDGALVLSPR